MTSGAGHGMMLTRGKISITVFNLLNGECMNSNIDRYKKDLEHLMSLGELLHLSMQQECLPEQFEHSFKQTDREDIKKLIKDLPSFTLTYQTWYSEAKVLIKQLLPDRLADFVSHYEKPKSRKEITYENYRIDDCLQGLNVTRGFQKEKIVGPDAAIPHFRQQLAILKSVKSRFESSLFDIRQLVQADLFDSELNAAQELAKNKFTRAAGALAGVVLERHLAQVCDNHNIKLTKKDPTIADLNNALKDANITDIPQWRFIQHLADIRNLCDHNKKIEPSTEQVDDLLAGVAKVTKTLY
ncbi:MAG: hypothetical protein ACYC6A_16775 [Armatimonadota bacterium]